MTLLISAVEDAFAIISSPACSGKVYFLNCNKQQTFLWNEKDKGLVLSTHQTSLCDEESFLLSFRTLIKKPSRLFKMTL